ncbi:uncharacterized protein LOC106094692 [Stomoxys calcitrans]|uniref:Kazal-like domain-containing protein n=1 Tax=Stomoxys calcitrans TaxID=35570 RepID=A0A1I8QC85_STOCA|nr:uncharacterized protein LOC106094692 [Stomoxys calcitrans]
MRTLQVIMIFISLLLATSLVEAGRRRKHKTSSEEPSASTKTKTKTKWTSSTDLAAHTHNAMVASEEHGYYVKRSFLPLSGSSNSSSLKSPPFLAVPIAWFPCQSADCMKLNAIAINSNKNSLAEGFLCDDDCQGHYEPICGKTVTEVAVFYNKCKLNVAKCRSHGYWLDLSYEECKTQYPEEVKYAEKKFRSNPFFCDNPQTSDSQKKPSVVLEELQQAQTEKQVATLLPLEPVTEPQVEIKEIHQNEAEAKQKESKDHYEKVENIQGVLAGIL